MGDFTKYELESIKITNTQNTQKNLKAKKMFMIRTVVFLCLMGIGLFCVYRLISKQDNQLEDAMKEDIPMSKEWKD